MFLRSAVLAAAASAALKQAGSQSYYIPEWGIDGGNLLAFGTKTDDNGSLVQMIVKVPLNGLTVVEEHVAQ